jgi:DNA-binding transcriptional ArsR family regulator
MNDDMAVNIWQDGHVSESNSHPGSEPAGPEVLRRITSVETVKALADPLRLRLLSALMATPADEELPVRSVKELAAELSEPQTKLYRHVKQLEAAGLIRVVATRVVSGIVEQRYQACQRDLVFGPELTEDERRSSGMEDMVAAGLDVYRARLFAAARAGLIDSSDSPGAEQYRRQLLTINETYVSPARAAVIRGRMDEIAQDLERYASEEADGERVPVNILLGYFSPAKREA